jgi:hypothetical protein
MPQGYDVVNVADIDAWLAGFSARVGAGPGAAWFKAKHVRRWAFQEPFLKRVTRTEGDRDFIRLKGHPKAVDALLGKLDEGLPLWAFDQRLAAENGPDLGHVSDWLAALPQDDPHLLPKIGKVTVDEAVRKAEEWTRRMIEEEELRPRGRFQPVLRCGDATWYRLLDGESLHHESAMMGHCVRTHAARVEQGRKLIYSLRDEKGRAHVTVDVTSGHAVECKGKQNRAPSGKHAPAIAALLNGVGAEGPCDDAERAAVFWTDGRWKLLPEITKPAVVGGVDVLTDGKAYWVAAEGMPETALARFVPVPETLYSGSILGVSLSEQDMHRIARVANALKAGTIRDAGLNGLHRLRGTEWINYAAGAKEVHRRPDGHRWHRSPAGLFLTPGASWSLVCGIFTEAGKAVHAAWGERIGNGVDRSSVLEDMARLAADHGLDAGSGLAVEISGPSKEGKKGLKPELLVGEGTEWHTVGNTSMAPAFLSRRGSGRSTPASQEVAFAFLSEGEFGRRGAKLFSAQAGGWARRKLDEGLVRGDLPKLVVLARAMPRMREVGTEDRLVIESLALARKLLARSAAEIPDLGPGSEPYETRAALVRICASLGEKRSAVANAIEALLPEGFPLTVRNHGPNITSVVPDMALARATANGVPGTKEGLSAVAGATLKELLQRERRCLRRPADVEAWTECAKLAGDHRLAAGAWAKLAEHGVKSPSPPNPSTVRPHPERRKGWLARLGGFLKPGG